MKNEIIKRYCKDCLLLDKFCSIRGKIEDETFDLEAFVQDCSQQDSWRRIEKADRGGLLPKGRMKIFYSILPIDYQYWGRPTVIETLKRSLDRWEQLYDIPEGERTEQVENSKWYIRLEIMMQFCKIAEDLAAVALSASKDFEKFTKSLILHGAHQIEDFYRTIKNKSVDEIAEFMGYPSLQAQSEKEGKLLEESCERVKTSMEVIGDEYLKFRPLYLAYKHGFRIHFGEIDVGSEHYDTAILFFGNYREEKKKLEMGYINIVAFPSADIKSFYENSMDAAKIIACIVDNHKQWFLKSEGVQEFRLSVYFPSMMDDLYKDRTNEYEFRFTG